MSWAVFVVKDCCERVEVIRETRDNPEERHRTQGSRHHGHSVRSREQILDRRACQSVITSSE